jgi:type III secretion system YscD/HrpQ family protein
MAMTGYLIAEEGPLSGTCIVFDNEDTWTIGRDPDEVSIVLEDPMVSRKHAICKMTSEGFILENLSTINPITQNGKVVADPVLLKENDIIQIGSTFFRFTFVAPKEETPQETPQELIEDLEPIDVADMSAQAPSSWLLKVITGPNSGAEFNLKLNTTYTLGKDASTCQLVFSDLSVSRQHARLNVSESGELFIEDLGSKNGVLVNGLKIESKTKLNSSDVIALGTTSFITIDQQIANETIVSFTEEPKEAIKEESKEEILSVKKDWKGIKISKNHLAVFSVLGLLLIAGVVSLLSLFNPQKVDIKRPDDMSFIESTLKSYPSVQFSYNSSSGKLFLIGHLLTNIDKQELMYALDDPKKMLIIEDNIVVDELVWQNVNALLSTNPNWEGIYIHAPSPGKFVVKGYVQSIQNFENLSDFLNLNFPYLDKLENQVVVESNLQMAIQGLLMQQGFLNVQFQLAQGDVALSGKLVDSQSSNFENFQKRLKALPGVRSVKSFVVFTRHDQDRVDISAQYQVTGFSKSDHDNFYVVINGKIVGTGDNLDGMMVTGVTKASILLEKDGLKYLINYNLQ